jgi:hypothetical protein
MEKLGSLHWIKELFEKIHKLRFDSPINENEYITEYFNFEHGLALRIHKTKRVLLISGDHDFEMPIRNYGGYDKFTLLLVFPFLPEDDHIKMVNNLQKTSGYGQVILFDLPELLDEAKKLKFDYQKHLEYFPFQEDLQILSDGDESDYYELKSYLNPLESKSPSPRKKQVKRTNDNPRKKRAPRRRKSVSEPSELTPISQELLAYNYFFAKVPFTDRDSLLKENHWKTESGFSRYANLVNKGNILLGISPNPPSNEERNLTYHIYEIGYVYKNDQDANSLGVVWKEIASPAFKPEEIADNTNLSLGEISKRNLIPLLQNISSVIKSPIEEIIAELKQKAEDLLERENTHEEIGDKTKEGETGGKTKEEELKEKITRLSGIKSDADSGTDYLDIEKDVQAFARVMCAKSLNPPLAIGLLGKWGSGKSFFMRKLQEEIEVLTQKNNNIYCEGIAEVHFNAWSYMDANLWAGIVTKIFERLDLYIKDEMKSDREENEVKQEITKKLSITSDTVIKLTKEKKEAHQKVENLINQKDQLDETLKQKSEEKQKIDLSEDLQKFNTEFKLTEKMGAALQENKSYIKTVENLKILVPEEYWKDPTLFYQQLNSQKTKTVFRQLFNKETWKKNGLIVLISMILLFAAPFLLDWFANFTTSITFKSICVATSSATTIAVGIFRSATKLRSVFSSLKDIQQKYADQKKSVELNFEEKKKALELEIQNSQSKIEALERQKQAAEKEEEVLKSRINNTLSSETLFQFIEKRAVTNDYEKHLGIVSIIRKDFEILSELFAKSENKRKSFTEKEITDFKEQFDRPLERIILYVDDLDRCSEERVVEVLEAVNLLMAFPLFIVVVGVDPRWVKIALQTKYEKQFTLETEEEGLRISASNYLEKIFQIPFRLKSAKDQTVKSMLRSLAEQKAMISKEKPVKIEEIKNVVATDPSQEMKGHLTQNRSHEEITNVDSSSTPEPPENDPQEAETIQGNTGEEEAEKIESLEFSITEIQLIQDMSPVLGSNPRAIKRFVNIYRVIKAHDIFDYDEKHQNQEILADLFLIALPFGKYRILVPSFMNFLKESRNYSIKTYLNRALKEEATEEEQREYETRKILLDELNKYGPNVLTVKKQHFNGEHLEFIKRFYFN